MTQRQAELLFVLVTLLGALGWLFSKKATAEFQPHTFLAIRFFLASGLLMLLAHKEVFDLSWRQILICMIPGTYLGVGLGLWIMGVNEANHIGEGAFIVSLNIVVATLMARFFFAEPITKNLLIALIPALLGLGLLTIKETIQLSTSQLFFLASIFGFALHLNLTRKYAPHIPTVPLTCWQLVATGTVALISATMTESWPTSISAESWGWLLASALIATCLRFTIQTKALQKVTASQASLIAVLEPIWVTVLGMAFLAEKMTTQQITGCALIFMALVVYRSQQIKTFWRSFYSA